MEFPTKPASVLLVMILVSSAWQVPVTVQPLVTVFDEQINGSQFFAQVRVQDSYYIGLALVNGTQARLVGLYSDTGIPTQGQAIMCGTPNAPINAPISSRAGSQPRKIPQCAAAWWYWFGLFCKNNTNATFADACSGSSSLSMDNGCIVPIYDTSKCVGVAHLHLSPTDAINNAMAIAVIAVVASAVVGIILAGPYGAVAAVIPTLIGLSYSQLYGTDKNSDNSFDLWAPIDWENIEWGIFGITPPTGFYVYTPRYWWQMLHNVVAWNVGAR